MTYRFEEERQQKRRESPMQESRYCSRVRMGNWNEEIILQEEKIKYFLRKKEKGELLVQKTRATFSNLMKEVTLLLPADHVSFGDPCQLLSPCPRTLAPEGLALGVLLGPREVDSRQHFLDGSLVSASPLTQPVIRNCFRISSPNSNCRKGEKLRYGENFTLSTVESAYESPLFVESEVPHMHSELGREGHAQLRLSTHKSISCLWRLCPPDPDSRLPLWGTPVPVNISVIVKHVASNKNLCLEPTSWMPSFLGAECEVSVHTDLNVYRRETDRNIWDLVANKDSQELYFQLKERSDIQE